LPPAPAPEGTVTTGAEGSDCADDYAASMNEGIEEIEGILRDAGLSVIYDDTNHPAGSMAVAFPLGHESGVLIGQPMGSG
jgi:hypothetical protein